MKNIKYISLVVLFSYVLGYQNVVYNYKHDIDTDLYNNQYNDQYNDYKYMVNSSEMNSYKIENNYWRFIVETSDGLLNIQCFANKKLISFCILKKECVFTHDKDEYQTYNYIIGVVLPNNILVNNNAIVTSSSISRGPIFRVEEEMGFLTKKGNNYYEIINKSTNFTIFSLSNSLNVICYDENNSIINQCIGKKECNFLHKYYIGCISYPYNCCPIYRYKINVISKNNDTIISYMATNNKNLHYTRRNYLLIMLIIFSLLIFMSIYAKNQNTIN